MVGVHRHSQILVNDDIALLVLHVRRYERCVGTVRVAGQKHVSFDDVTGLEVNLMNFNTVFITYSIWSLVMVTGFTRDTLPSSNFFSLSPSSSSTPILRISVAAI